MPTHLSLSDALNEADGLYELITKHFYGHSFDGSDRTILSLGAIDVAVGHFLVISQLARNRSDVDSTIRALMRPLLEAAFRALWLKAVALDELIYTMQEAPNWRGWPGIEQIASQLDTACGTGSQFFTAAVTDVWLAHDFTHCGLETIRRHYHPGAGIGPLSNERERATMVHKATVVLGGTAATYLEHLGDQAAGLEIAAHSIRRVTKQPGPSAQVSS